MVKRWVGSAPPPSFVIQNLPALFVQSSTSLIEAFAPLCSLPVLKEQFANA